MTSCFPNSFWTQLDGNAKLLLGAVACVRTINTRASIVIISCMRAPNAHTLPPPPKPRRRGRARPTSTGRERDPMGEINERAKARAAARPLDPCTYFHARAGHGVPCLTDPARNVRALCSSGRGRDAGRPLAVSSRPGRRSCAGRPAGALSESLL